MTATLVLAQAQQAASSGPDYTLLIWAIVLIGVAIALFMVELFIPSGGLIGIGAAIALVAGIVMMFGVDTTLGLISTLVTLIALPFAFAAALKLWPETPIGRLMMLRTDESAAAPTDDPTPDTGEPVKVGDRGKAVTELYPGGVCLIHGQRVQCISDRGMVQAGAEVRVTEVTGFGPKVRAVED